MLVALVALRKIENGGEGKEFGVLSVTAPTYAQQLHVSAFSLKHREATEKVRKPDVPTRDPDGFFTSDFLTGFSHQWAPVDADNDPTGLNVFHAKNLVTKAAVLTAELRAVIADLT